VHLNLQAVDVTALRSMPRDQVESGMSFAGFAVFSVRGIDGCVQCPEVLLSVMFCRCELLPEVCT
jgi:hypothetical protein